MGSVMAMKIAILEDNLDRQAAMRACLADRFPMFELRFFDEAAEMIRYLDSHLADTIAISLDHDLDMKHGSDGRLIDPGTGQEVAEYLAGKGLICPIVIHTTNSDGAERMKCVLEHEGWKTRRVMPFNDMRWIESDWFFAMRRAIVGPIKRKRSGSRS
jgi:NAD+-processing family protein with receiver domain